MGCPLLDIMVPNRTCKDWYILLLPWAILHNPGFCSYCKKCTDVNYDICTWSQLNLMEPPHDGYYVNQHSIQGLVSHDKFNTMIYIFFQ